MTRILCTARKRHEWHREGAECRVQGAEWGGVRGCAMYECL